MIEKMSKFLVKHKRAGALMSLALMLCVMVSSTLCYAADETTETTPSLNIDFEVTEMFSWAEMMINAMKPVMYITMGVGLAFLILGAFQSIFARAR